MLTKRCFKCGDTKPIVDFYRHSKMADGHLGKCKECTKRDVREHYAGTIDQRRAYERERYQRPERKRAAMGYLKDHRRREPEKYKARQAVNNAIRDGTLVRKPCEVCGATEGVEGHHDDYSKPLDVRWFCFEHHRQYHGQMAWAT